jgi:translocation and assembly module TamB
LTLPPGPLAAQVQITPAMCATALKYIAPVLADVSTARGSFSISLDGCRVPLEDPAKGELAGQLTIHSVEVGPGPLVRELAILLGRAAPATLRRESVVQFRMVGGRVYHQGLELIFPDLTIRTYGSVGLDQTMAIMAEMPVPPKWLGNNVLGSAMRDQIIRLPIGGSLSSPQIDRRELERVSGQFLENAARNVIEDELNRQLERLLGPPR